MKKILIYDTCTQTIESLKLLFNEFKLYEAEIVTNFQEIADRYTNNMYEFIIIEHNCKNSNELINFICSNNPSQKVILLSDSINCPIDCNSCLSTFKFVRLLKPIDFKTIVHYLNLENHFLCPNKHRFDSINTIEQLYDFINLTNNRYYTNKERKGNKLIVSSEMNNTISVEELTKIEDNINKKYFKFEVLENTIIISEI